MMFVLPILTTWLQGRLILRLLILPSDSWFLTSILALGLGLGLSSVSLFFLFLFGDGFHPIVFLVGQIIILLILWMLNKKRFEKTEMIKGDFFDLLGVALIALYAFFVDQFSLEYPFGQWDAWALWNMKFRFLIHSGSDWENIFKLHAHTQPDYPLLLPLMNIVFYTFSPIDLNQTPRLLSILITCLTAALLYGVLRKHVSSIAAMLGFLLLATSAPFIYLGTAQYADGLLSFYLLASIFSLLQGLKYNHPGWMSLAAIFMGWMAFTKNEGIVLAALLIISTAGYLTSKKLFDTYRKIIKTFCFTLLAACLPIVIFKIIAPSNPDFLFSFDFTRYKFFNYEGCYIIFSFAWQTLTEERWGGLWPILAVLFLFSPQRILKKENKVLSIFFLMYAVILFFVYLTTMHFELTWRIPRTLPRILFYLIPSLLFSVFKIAFEKSSANADHLKTKPLAGKIVNHDPHLTP